MDNSILTSIKKMLGITEEYEHFDQDLIIHINSVLMVLTQIGVGPSDGFSIIDKTATWNDFLNSQSTVVTWTGEQNINNKLGLIQSYVYSKVKLSFDPPQNSFLVDSMNKIINEQEWRLNVMFDKAEFDETETKTEQLYI